METLGPLDKHLVHFSWLLYRSPLAEMPVTTVTARHRRLAVGLHPTEHPFHLKRLHLLRHMEPRVPLLHQRREMDGLNTLDRDNAPSRLNHSLAFQTMGSQPLAQYPVILY